MDTLWLLLAAILSWLGGRGLMRSMRSNGRPWGACLAGGGVCGALAVVGFSLMLDGVGLVGKDGFDWLGLVAGLVFLMPLWLSYSVSYTAREKSATGDAPTGSPLSERLAEQRASAKAAVSSPEWKHRAEKARKKADHRGSSGASVDWKQEVRKHQRKSSPPPPVRSQSRPNASRSSRSNLSFSYTAADGETTIREVSNWRADRTYIKGICLDRGEERTFRRDRIDYFLSGEDLLDAPAPAKPVPKPRSTPKKPEILFTGFDSAARLELEDLAWDADMTIRQTVTKNLTYLIAGPRAGATKLRQASERGATVLDERQFRHMIETGEILDH